MSINPYSSEILTDIGLTVKQGQVVRLLDEDGATFGRGATLCDAVLAAFATHPAEAKEHAAALLLAVALDEDEDAVLEAVNRILGGDDDAEDDEEEDEEDAEEEEEEEDENPIRVRRE